MATRANKPVPQEDDLTEIAGYKARIADLEDAASEKEAKISTLVECASASQDALTLVLNGHTQGLGSGTIDTLTRLRDVLKEASL